MTRATGGAAPDGATPIDPDEAEGLIPADLVSQRELNEWEARNIREAARWLSAARGFDPLAVHDLRELHRRMFDQTWRWAGAFRKSDKSVTPHHWTQLPVLMRNLGADTRAQLDASDRSPASLDDIAARFHHTLVRIHPWPNGNGRHARLATDVLLERNGRPSFTWGSANLVADGEARTRYIAALRAADRGDFSPLTAFVRR